MMGLVSLHKKEERPEHSFMLAPTHTLKTPPSTLSLSHSFSPNPLSTMWGHSKKMAYCMPQREPFWEPNPLVPYLGLSSL